MYCKNLLIRHKQTRIVFYCKKDKRYIDYRLDCENCSNRILVKNKSINKVSKKRITVSKETYQKVYERDSGMCRICGNRNIQLHHIVYRSENKKLIDCPENCIMLCLKCHKMVHSNKHYWQEKLKKMLE